MLYIKFFVITNYDKANYVGQITKENYKQD